jgi:hypothetical protein
MTEEKDEARRGFFFEGAILFWVSNNLQAGGRAAGEAARHDTAQFKKNSNN